MTRILRRPLPAIAVGVTLLVGTACSEAVDGANATAATVEVSASSSTSSTAAPTPTTGAAARTLIAFADPASVTGWSTVDDRVMGGVSRSTVDWQEGRLRFRGTVSLENNGGFSSVRGPLGEFGGAAAGATTFVVGAVGDGTTYLLQVVDRDGGRWVQRFRTTAGVDTDHDLPVTGFEPVTSRLNPRIADAPLDPARVVQFTIFVVDDQTGPFEVRISRFAAR